MVELDTVNVKCQKDSDRAERESLVLWRRPIQTCIYCILELTEQLRSLASKFLRKRALVVGLIAWSVFYVIASFFAGPHQFYFGLLRRYIWFFIYWVGLGVLSSIGMGTGMHTFLLYLGPHIASVTLAAYECSSLNFPRPPYPDNIICPAEPYIRRVPSLWAIMSKVRLESFLWGVGTALGELPPYFMAKAARLTGSDLDDDDSELAEFETLNAKSQLDDLSLLDKSKVLMKRIVASVGFYGILACASIPNPFFDLAGITCGHFLVPFWTFFGATLIGKAIIKTHIQKILVIIAFSETIFDRAINILSKVPVIGSKLQQSLNDFLLSQKKRLRAKQDGHGVSGSSSGNLLSKSFQTFTTLMLAFFVLSIINSFAQNYCKRLQKEKRIRKASGELPVGTAHLKQC